MTLTLIDNIINLQSVKDHCEYNPRIIMLYCMYYELVGIRD